MSRPRLYLMVLIVLPLLTCTCLVATHSYCKKRQHAATFNEFMQWLKNFERIGDLCPSAGALFLTHVWGGAKGQKYILRLFHQ